MDELNQSPNSNPRTELVSLASSTPVAADQNPPNSEDTSSKSESVLIPEFSSEAPASVPPATVTSIASWIERYWKLVLIAILLLAIGLRTRGLNWDESQHLHPDERFLTMVESAIKLPTSWGEYFDTAKSPLNPYNNNFGSLCMVRHPSFLSAYLVS